MNLKSFVGCAGLLIAAVVRADSNDEAIVAAMNLSSATNYSWTSTINQNGHSAEIRGKTGDHAYSLLTFIGYSNGGRNGGGSDSSGINTVFLGNKYVVETPQGWANPVDVSPTTAGVGTTPRTGGGMGTRSGGRGARGGGGVAGQRTRTNGGNVESSVAGGLPLPAGINLPHEELAIVAANYADMHEENGAVTGTLTSTGADLLLVPPGSTQPSPAGAAGTFRLWVKDGAVTKYELRLTAEFRAGRGKSTETITVDLSNMGSTRFEVPDAAKRKLGL